MSALHPLAKEGKKVEITRRNGTVVKGTVVKVDETYMGSWVSVNVGPRGRRQEEGRHREGASFSTAQACVSLRKRDTEPFWALVFCWWRCICHQQNAKVQHPSQGSGL